jgi:dihydroorotase
MDMRSTYQDPGDEYKEGLSNGLRVAAAGGFTAVALSPDTVPPVDNKGLVEYLINRSKGSGVRVVPIGGASKKLKGESMSEMYDMYQAGARGFGDGKRSIAESGLLKRALLYTAQFNAPVLHFPYDQNLLPNGQINEGELSTSLGLKGIPSISEEMIVRRDLTLLEYTKGKLHLGPLSSARSIELVNKAKTRGADVTCEVGVANLVFNEGRLSDFDTTYKVLPPLRDEENRRELIEAFRQGEIDVISSDHCPEDEEHKKVEFDLANFGMATQELFFPLVNAVLGGEVEMDKLVASFSTRPREILGLDLPEIREGQVADLVVFDPEAAFEPEKFISKGFNLPAVEKGLKGKVIRTIFNEGAT